MEYIISKDVLKTLEKKVLDALKSSNTKISILSSDNKIILVENEKLKFLLQEKLSGFPDSHIKLNYGDKLCVAFTSDNCVDFVTLVDKVKTTLKDANCLEEEIQKFLNHSIS